MPLRFLAFGQIIRSFRIVAFIHRVPITVIAVGLLCLVELRQYIILFVRYPLYELVSLKGCCELPKILKSQ